MQPISSRIPNQPVTMVDSKRSQQPYILERKHNPARSSGRVSTRNARSLHLLASRHHAVRQLPQHVLLSRLYHRLRQPLRAEMLYELKQRYLGWRRLHRVLVTTNKSRRMDYPRLASQFHGEMGLRECSGRHQEQHWPSHHDPGQYRHVISQCAVGDNVELPASLRVGRCRCHCQSS